MSEKYYININVLNKLSNDIAKNGLLKVGAAIEAAAKKLMKNGGKKSNKSKSSNINPLVIASNKEKLQIKKKAENKQAILKKRFEKKAETLSKRKKKGYKKAIASLRKETNKNIKETKVKAIARTKSLNVKTKSKVARIKSQSKGYTSIPSPPGSPPNRQTGNLVNSITYAYDSVSKSLVVGPIAKYGGIHETGGKIKVKSHKRKSSKGKVYNVKSHTKTYPARPFMKPAFDMVKGKILNYFRSSKWTHQIQF